MNADINLSNKCANQIQHDPNIPSMKNDALTVLIIKGCPNHSVGDHHIDEYMNDTQVLMQMIHVKNVPKILVIGLRKR